MIKQKSLSEYYHLSEKQNEVLPLIGKGKFIFYGGARGGGKSWLALCAAWHVCLTFPAVQVVIIRENYSELEDVFLNKVFLHFPENIFGYRYVPKYNYIKFPNQSRLLFRSCETTKDTKKIQGSEYQFMIIDEAPNLDYDVIEKILGSVRNSHVPNFSETVLYTGNPGGLSDYYFMTRFVEKDYDVWEEGELERIDDYIFIEAKLDDNPSEQVRTQYRRMLKTLSENQRKAWLDGDWHVFEGRFFEEWREDKHIVEGFDIPKDWVRAAGHDVGWSKSHPSVALWAAQDPSDGTVYVYNEYVNYTVPENLADGMLYQEPDAKNILMHCDPTVFGKDLKLGGQRVADFFWNKIPVAPAINDRVAGWRVVKQWLHCTQETQPKLKIFRNCMHLIRTLPTLRYANKRNMRTSGEDLDTKQADDAADALRYLLISSFHYPQTDTADIDAKTIKELDLYEEEEKLGYEEDGDYVYSRFEDEMYISPTSYYM